MNVLLSDLIQALRTDLLEGAKKRPANWRPLFDIAEATVEVQTRLARETKGKGGFKLYVVSMGAEVGEADETTQKISIRLTPAAQGREIVSGGRDALVAGKSARKPLRRAR
jgi:hypothetical protein